jgi:hypothetical protein
MRHRSEAAAIRPTSSGKALKEVLRKHRPDAEWAAELRELRKAVGRGQIRIGGAPTGSAHD